MRRGGYLSLGIKDVFNPKGRIDRVTYFIYGLMLAVIFYVTGYVGQIAHTVLMEVFPPKPSNADLYIFILVPAFYALLLLPSYYGTFCISAKRLHDLGWPAIIGLISVLYPASTLATLVTKDERVTDIIDTLFWVSMGLHLLLLFVPGQRGPNRYGENSVGAALPKPKILEDE